MRRLVTETAIALLSRFENFHLNALLLRSGKSPEEKRDLHRQWQEASQEIDDLDKEVVHYPSSIRDVERVGRMYSLIDKKKQILELARKK